jgi:hypothetical protein
MARTKKTPRTFEEMARTKFGEHAIVVFHSPYQGTVSPGVSAFWKQPVVDLLVEAGPHIISSDVHVKCALFIGWCFARPDVDKVHLRVASVREPFGWLVPEDQKARYAGLMAVLSEFDPPPVLVNVDFCEITCEGQVLWRPGADAVRSVLETIRMVVTRDEDYKEYEDRIKRAEYSYLEAWSVFEEVVRKSDSEPSRAVPRPIASNSPDSPRSKDKKGKVRKRPPRP